MIVLGRRMFPLLVLRLSTLANLPTVVRPHSLSLFLFRSLVALSLRVSLCARSPYALLARYSQFEVIRPLSCPRESSCPPLSFASFGFMVLVNYRFIRRKSSTLSVFASLLGFSCWTSLSVVALALLLVNKYDNSSWLRQLFPRPYFVSLILPTSGFSDNLGIHLVDSATNSFGPIAVS